MFISKFQIDIHSPSARRALSNRQDMHRNLPRWFETDRKSSETLFRLATTRTGHYLYVYSHICPSLSDEEGKRLGMYLQKTRNIDISELYKQSGKYRFNLETSPSKKIKCEGRKNSRRVFLIDPAERKDWLDRIAARNGFRILAVEENKSELLRITKVGSDAFINSVMYDGVLEVENVELFNRAIQNGIGPEKAYGLGLLLIRDL